MPKRYALVFFLILLLAACAPAVGPVVSSIVISQDTVHENQPVSVTLTYTNNDASQTYINVVLLIQYPAALEFVSADQSPTLCGAYCLEWKLGSLPGGTGGTIQTNFKVAGYIDPTTYDLPISASISSLNAGLTPAPSGSIYASDSNGGSYSKSSTLFILGRPTPTYIPPSTDQAPGENGITAPAPVVGSTPVPTPEPWLNPTSAQIIVASIGGCVTIITAIIAAWVTLRAARSSGKDK